MTDVLVAGPGRAASRGPDWHALLRWLRRMRTEHPVWHDRGLVHLFRYADVQRALSDWRAFSSDRTALMPPTAQLGPGNLTMMDPPDHTLLRRVVSQAFTPRSVAALEPRVHALVGQLLDEAGDAEMDVVRQLAGPLPVVVIAELLGVPVADRPLFEQWSSGFSRADAVQMQQMHEYLVDRCRRRRRAPADDLLSRLVTADVAGRRTSDDEAASLAGLLLLAGHITTTVLIGNAVLTLDEDDALRAQVLADLDDAVPRLVEETLRFRPPFTQVARLVTQDVELSGTTVAAGSVVLAWVLSANHDPAVFAAPDQVDLARTSQQHLAFGHGIHFCLGTPLARLEGRVALVGLLRRFPLLRVRSPQDLEFHEHPTLALKRLPVTC